MTSGKWQMQEKRIARQYAFPDMPTPESTTSLRIVCSLMRHPNGVVGTYLRFYLRPYVHLLPDRQPFDPEDGLVKAPFSVGLFAAGSGIGTQADPLLRGGLFEVSACGIEDEPETVLLDVTEERDAILGVKAISTGEELTFTVYDNEADPPVKLRLELPNDRDFARLYSQRRAEV